jgi:starch synthase (maltosyl-transferring)
VHDEVSGQTYRWGEYNFVRLVPDEHVAHVLRLPSQAPLV